jgi:NitT/TauT family transport system substrate-binding protein
MVVLFLGGGVRLDRQPDELYILANLSQEYRKRQPRSQEAPGTMSPHRRLRRIVIGGAIAALTLGLLSGPASARTRHQSDEADTLHLGFFPNVTHSTALVGIEEGIFEKNLGKTSLETATFSTGTEAGEALLAGAIDATYIGPNPAINAFAQTGGEVKIISGATSGGAFLVVNDDIKKPKDLEGKVLSSPSLGNTQDVALRVWLDDKGFETDETGGGDVSIRPQENSLTLQAFQAGDIDGAWVPEPWATRLVEEGGGHVLVNEADLWPEGRYVTTHLLVRKDFFDDNPGVIRKLLNAQVEANSFIAENPKKAQQDVAKEILDITGKEVSEELVATTFRNLEFTNDPIASSLQKSARDAESVGLLEPVDLDGIYALKPLNKILEARGQLPVQST